MIGCEAGPGPSLFAAETLTVLLPLEVGHTSGGRTSSMYLQTLSTQLVAGVVLMVPDEF